MKVLTEVGGKTVEQPNADVTKNIKQINEGVNKIYIFTNNMYFIMCPHCNIGIEIVELNCMIFRCGIYKHNFTQIHPHMPEAECLELVGRDAIYGCGKPFKLVNMVPTPCEYI